MVLYVAVVRDTDGSAFITKAEFDSLKNNFQAQIDNYNSSIDSKIDGAIASYLAGVKISSEDQITGGFSNYNQLKFYNTFGIKTYSFNTRAGDSMVFAGDPDNSPKGPTGSDYVQKIGNCILPLDADQDRTKSLVFDFYGQDSVMARLNRLNNAVYPSNWHWFRNAFDQSALSFTIPHLCGPSSGVYNIVGGLTVYFKFGPYNYFGKAGGEWQPTGISSSYCRSNPTIGDQGLTTLGGFALDTASKNTVEFLRPGVGWSWINQQSDNSGPYMIVKDVTKPFTRDNMFSTRFNWNSIMKPATATTRWELVSAVPDGYAMGFRTYMSWGSTTNQEVSVLIPNSYWEMQNAPMARYCLDPTFDYRFDTTKDFLALGLNYKSDTPFLMCDSREKQDVSDVMLAFDSTQDLYISKYGLKRDTWPLGVDDVQTGTEAVKDENIAIANAGSNAFVLSTLGNFDGWSDANLPIKRAQHDGPDFTINLPSLVKYDHLHNFDNYISSISGDPLKINGGIRIGRVNASGMANFKLKVTRSNGAVTDCKVYLKNSSFNDAVPLAAECITGTWDGGSGALCGITPNIDGTLNVTFPAMANDEVWIMVSPESRMNGCIAADDPSYAYAQLVQCDGRLIKDN